VTTRLARLGLLVTRPDVVERLARIDTVVLDKTGTLTLGRLRVAATRLVPRSSGDTVAGAADAADALAVAAALGAESSHPVGAAFAPYARAGLAAVAVRELPALGVEGEVDGAHWRLGRREFVLGGRPEAASAPLPAAGSDSVVALARDGVLVAEFDVSDALREEAGTTLAALRALGLDIVIASGDRPQAVAAVAAALGVEPAYGGLRPEQKLQVVRDLEARGRHVLMIGDGINDGPVLAAAAVSCAMGQGSAIAQVAADLLLVGDSLQALAGAIACARQGLRVIRQNLAWALVYNLAAVPLAALGLVLPWVAAIGMSLSSLGVVLNARRIAGDAVARRPPPEADASRRHEESYA
jgi:Cu2+-exporting ATPase